MIKNEKGFGIIEVVLVVLVIGLLITVGWLFFDRQNSKKQDSKSLEIVSQNEHNETATTDPTASWITYTGPDSRISLKYPTTWVTASDPSLCSSGVLLLGASSNSVGKCGSEDFGQMSVTWQPSHAYCGDLNSDAWTVDSTENVTVSGISGLKQTATAKAPSPRGGSEPEGTKVVNYCFNSNNYTYVANYTHKPTYPDVLSDFNVMITKTLKFDQGSAQ